jgi:hypothetical protein
VEEDCEHQRVVAALAFVLFCEVVGHG